jgi:hypothetical protein
LQQRHCARVATILALPWHSSGVCPPQHSLMPRFLGIGLVGSVISSADCDFAQVHAA